MLNKILYLLIDNKKKRETANLPQNGEQGWNLLHYLSMTLRFFWKDSRLSVKEQNKHHVSEPLQ
jgi:hypothetical protein